MKDLDITSDIHADDTFVTFFRDTFITETNYIMLPPEEEKQYQDYLSKQFEAFLTLDVKDGTLPSDFMIFPRGTSIDTVTDYFKRFMGEDWLMAQLNG